MTVSNKRKSHRKRKKILILTALVLVLSGSVMGVLYLTRDMFSFTLTAPIPLDTPFNLPPRNADAKTREIEAFLTKEGIAYSRVSVASDSSILVSLSNNGDVYLSSENYPEELTTLQVIVSKITMEGKRFSRLDLRFERPVIVMP